MTFRITPVRIIISDWNVPVTLEFFSRLVVIEVKKSLVLHLLCLVKKLLVIICTLQLLECTSLCQLIILR